MGSISSHHHIPPKLRISGDVCYFSDLTSKGRHFDNIHYKRCNGNKNRIFNEFNESFNYLSENAGWFVNKVCGHVAQPG
jgi:hypothetical protein